MVHAHIATAAEGDQEWCARLMASSEPWITLKRDLDACREVMKRPGSELFVARDQGTSSLLGFILLAPYGLAGSPYISSIAVAPDARGKRLGAQLLRFAEQRYYNRQHIFLLVSEFNAGAQRFYRRNGYEFVGELDDYIVRGHSELLFLKRLA